MEGRVENSSMWLTFFTYLTFYTDLRKTTEPPPRQGGGKVADVDGMISKLQELGAI